MFHRTCELESEAKIVLRIGVACGGIPLRVGIGDPGGARFADRAMFRIFITDPLGFPFFLQQSRFPPAHVACRVRLSIFVPNLHPPVVARGSGQFRTAVRHAKRLVRSDAPAVPYIRLAAARSAAVADLDPVGRLPCAETCILQLPGEQRLGRIDAQRLLERVASKVSRLARG